MKSSTRDNVEGTFHEVKGKVKEIAGKVTDNPKLKAEGIGEELAGTVQRNSRGSTGSSRPSGDTGKRTSTT